MDEDIHDLNAHGTFLYPWSFSSLDVDPAAAGLFSRLHRDMATTTGASLPSRISDEGIHDLHAHHVFLYPWSSPPRKTR